MSSCVQSRLYLGTRFLCTREVPESTGLGKFRSTRHYFCPYCGDVWAREIHPKENHHYTLTAPCRKCSLFGGTFFVGQDYFQAFFDKNLSRFPKDLLLYELSILPSIPYPGYETDLHGSRRQR